MMMMMMNIIIIIIIVTSFAPISSKIKLSGATKPGEIYGDDDYDYGITTTTE